MGFESGRKFGKLWDDAQKLDDIIKGFNFNITGKKERDFEHGFTSALTIIENSFNSKIISQTNKATTVKSIYCFGKNHRPDITLEENGVAIEIKLISYAGLKDAIGQGYLYRLRYKFVFLILIISGERKTIYEDLNKGKEKDLEHTLAHLAQTMNIFTYVVPAFNIKPGVKKCIHFFNEDPPMDIAQ